MDRKAYVVILIAIFLFAPVLAHAQISKDNILEYKNFVSLECKDSHYEDITATSTATTTIEICDLYVIKDKVKIKYIGDEAPFADNEIASQRKSDVQVFDLGKKRINKRIYVDDHFIFSRNEWRSIETEILDKEDFDEIYNGLELISGAGAQTIYSSSSDGIIQNYQDGTWANCIADTDGTQVYDTDSVNNEAIGIRYTTNPGYLDCLIRRGFFDFATIGEINGTLESASFNWRGSYQGWFHDTQDSLTITGGTAGPTLDTADFDEVEATELTDSPIAYADFETTGYNQFVFNSAGLAWISNATNTQISLRMRSYDVLGNSPNQFNTAGISAMGGYFSEQSGTDYDPYLSLTFQGSSTPVVDPRIDEWYCIATTSGTVVETRCQAPILVWLVIAFFAVCVGAMGVLFFKRK